MKKGAILSQNRLSQKSPKISLLLDNIRSVHNVGSIFRTADAFGVAKIYLAGCTPTPVDRFGRERADLAKVALGAEKQVTWEYVADAIDFVKKMKAKKQDRDQYQYILALEQDTRAVPLSRLRLDSQNKKADKKDVPLLLILGNEVNGVDPKLIDLADEILEIPMRGTKESLNVSVSAGIALFALSDRDSASSATADARYKNGRSGRRPPSA